LGVVRVSSESGNRRLPDRRDLLKILAVGGAGAAAWKLGLFDRMRTRQVTRSRTLMGTGIHLTVLGDDLEAAEAAADATLGRMADLEALLSRYQSGSEVSLLNRTGHVQASDALLDVLRLANRISEAGDGAFDITVQPLLDAYRRSSHSDGADGAVLEQAVGLVNHRGVRIDGAGVSLAQPGMAITLDGIGKGYVVDRGVDVLKQRGFHDVFVEAGGDLVASGEKSGGVPWRIGIRSPRAGSALQARFDARNRAVATSGDYMQPFTADYAQHHILDPRTGYSSPELASSTVMAPDAATADALATLTMVLGSRRGRDLLEQMPDCEGYFVSKDLQVTRTTGFEVA
jgi:thiamine biosynthesis lipoprotein